MSVGHLTHRFVISFPDDLEEGILYVSMPYDTTIHLCACGCRNRVVLPLDPTGWQLTYNGRSVSMSPSVGNWGFTCRSHYVIDRGAVRWAPSWTQEQVAAGRRRTLRERGVEPDTASDEPRTPPSFWQRLIGLAKRLTSRR